MTNSRARGTYIVKKVNETVNNSVTMQDDDELFYPVSGSKVYSGYFILFIDSDVAQDFKYQVTGPSGATAQIGGGNISSDTPVTPVAIATSITVINTAGVDLVFIPFTMTTSTTAGTIQLQWAQNTQIVADTKVYAGSMLQLFMEK